MRTTIKSRTNGSYRITCDRCPDWADYAFTRVDAEEAAGRHERQAHGPRCVCGAPMHNPTWGCVNPREGMAS